MLFLILSITSLADGKCIGMRGKSGNLLEIPDFRVVAHQLPGINDILPSYICCRRDGCDRVHIGESEPHGKHSVFLHEGVSAADRITVARAETTPHLELNQTGGERTECQPNHSHGIFRAPMAYGEAHAAADDNKERDGPEIERKLLMTDDF